MRKKGMTLIEILVSIALLGMLAAAFLPVFSGGISIIAKAGKRSASGYKTQKNVEETLGGNATGTIVSSSGINITLPDGSSLNCPGKIEKNTDNQVTITYFVPDI